jgi:hypothetical protein
MNVKDEDILGSLVSFQREGRVLEINDSIYQAYVKFIRVSEKQRTLNKKIGYSIKSTIKRIIHI